MRSGVIVSYLRPGVGIADPLCGSLLSVVLLTGIVVGSLHLTCGCILNRGKTWWKVGVEFKTHLLVGVTQAWAS